MIHLLDVNVLLALGYPPHALHDRAIAWLSQASGAKPSVRLATCSITELGFIRVASGAAGWAPNVHTAIEDLQNLKSRWPMLFLEDGVSGEHLDEWVEKPKQVTDGHLLQVAAAHGGTLITFDRGIPGAYLIPELERPSSAVHEPSIPYGIAPRPPALNVQQL